MLSQTGSLTPFPPVLPAQVALLSESPPVATGGLSEMKILSHPVALSLSYWNNVQRPPVATGRRSSNVQRPPVATGGRYVRRTLVPPPELRWFHITAHTYGVWLPGDPRGFRTRHHREHVDGDYKNPPPTGLYTPLLARSRSLLKQEPVRLDMEWREIVGGAVRERLIGLGSQVIAIGMSATHVHVQVQLPPAQARQWTGFAKRHAWFVARDRGWIGQLWAKRSRAEPIRDRKHQENTFAYIVRHRNEGAWVWTFRDGLPESQKSQKSQESPPVATGGL